MKTKFADNNTNQQSDDQFSWQAHPARQKQTNMVIAIVVISAIAILVYLLSNTLLWSTFSALVLIIALQRFFFPSRFKIDSKGITAQYFIGKKYFDWQYIRRFNYDVNGGYLSTRKIPTRLDAYRGMHLYFNEDRTEIIKRIEEKIKVNRP
ncbi:MAG: hypothetical protein KAK01_02975 [Candidatus Marinimicrobia bacterium]|nr:hypothetical protein [Candidatus Neomarinimicrobiota bacterium]